MKAILLLPLTTLLASGQNLIQDPSFESPALPADSALGSVGFFNGGSSIGGAWNVTGPADRNVLTVHQNFDTFADTVSHGFAPAQTGVQYLDLSGAYFTGAAPVVSQDFATIPGQLYTLSFYLGASDGFNATANSQHAPLDTIQVQVSDTTGPNILSDTLTAPAPLVTANGTQIQWGQQTFVFSAISSSTRLSFQDLSGFDDNTSLVDSVSVSAVPESAPASWMLGITACGLFALYTPRRAQPLR